MTVTVLDATTGRETILNGEPTIPAPHNLLIIDDEVDIVKALGRQFRRHYNIHVANSASAGYELMKQVAIHVIISDQRMPGMSGVEFFDQVKNEFPDAIRLLLTGYADIQSVITAINDGNIFRYITKPWHPAELDTIVREAFVKHDLIIENRQLFKKLEDANQFLEKRVVERTAELHWANRQLQRLNEQKDRLMGMVAHDLRGPVGTIQMCTELLRTDSLDQAEQLEFIGMMEEMAKNALHLINDLLDVAAIESGKLVIEPQVVEIGQIVARISHLNTLIGERKGIKLVIKVDPKLSKVHLDPRRMQQVLDNLLSNAFKYSHPGTTVTLQLNGEGQDLLIAVTDQGQGIPPTELDFLFKPFQRTSTRPTSEELSTGLGLSICKRIVELHHGTIGAESVVGYGTTFMIRLPASLTQPR